MFPPFFRYAPRVRASAGRRVTATTLVLLGFATAGPSQAQLFTFDDTFTLTTSGQSLFSSSGAQGWNYDSGLIGSRWGTYAGRQERSFGINAIGGSEHELIFPGIPDIPAEYGEICDPFFGSGCTRFQITPAIPGTPAVYADTRTGASARFTSSGEVGLRFRGASSGGSVSASLPFATQVQMTKPVVIPYGDREALRLGGRSSLDQGASFSASGLDVALDVSGTLSMRNTFSATGCTIGAGCATSSSPVNLLAGTFGVVGIDTSQDHFLKVAQTKMPGIEFDRDYEIRKATSDSVTPVVVCPKGSLLCSADRQGVFRPAGPNLATFNASALDDHSTSTRTGEDTLKLTATERVLTVKLDITGVGQVIAGLPVDVLNPNVALGGVAAFSGTLAQAQVGIGQSLTQKLELTAKPSVAMTFDEDVLVLYFEAGGGLHAPFVATDSGPMIPVASLPPGRHGGAAVWRNVGRTVTFDLDSDIYVRFADGTPGKLESRRYFIGDDADFTTEFLLDIDPVFSIAGGCGKITLVANLGNTGLACVLDEEVALDGPSVQVIRKKFDLGGFDDKTFHAGDNGVEITNPGDLGGGPTDGFGGTVGGGSVGGGQTGGPGGIAGGGLNGFVLANVFVEISTPVPEPATSGLMLVGLGVIAGVTRRSRA